MKDTVSHYILRPDPLTSTAPQPLSNNLTMPRYTCWLRSHAIRSYPFRCRAEPGHVRQFGARGRADRDAVASVAGNTITVTSSDANGNTKQTTVTVDDKTKYTKQASANSDAITPGKCLNARGTMDNGGTLQATTINLRPANDGKCGASRRTATAGNVGNPLVRGAPVGTPPRNARSERRRCLPPRLSLD